ncbi:MAG TPA: LON peptidase substrate-binding domain-containing protein [Burkholderiaceae bacterium]|nr:LON peptidase substrate-binding domain-containing protein [Burkholderiaceae bacterium]
MGAPAPLDLFPLRSVLFPGAVLHLKVFEARYLDLVGRCLREARPFGVVCLSEGPEVGRDQVRFETEGVLAHIESVDAEAAGLLRVRCRGGSRFALAGAARQQADGLWVADVAMQADDAVLAPEPDLDPTVQALAHVIASLRNQGSLPFAEPLRLDDAGWIANRWCEILPVPLPAKQKLMVLPDPQARLRLVHEYLKGKGVVR